MRHLFLNILVLLILIGCNEKNNQLPSDLINNPNTASDKKKSKLPELTFYTDVHDFGNVKQGERLTHFFKFKNTGKADLLIYNAVASCGCTVPSYPKKPLRPGEEGQIQVVFKTEGNKGMLAKTITVMANTQPNSKVLTIIAEIKE